MSKDVFDKLKPEQKEAIMDASKKAEAYFSAESKKLDDDMVAAFKKANVNVVTMSTAQADKWRAVAQQTSFKTFSEKVPGGKALLDKALAVK